MTSSTTYRVTGMTCDHCVSAVQDEIGSLPGVLSVNVDLQPDAPSDVEVVSDGPLSVDAVRDAVDEAGYILVEPSP